MIVYFPVHDVVNCYQSSFSTKAADGVVNVDHLCVTLESWKEKCFGFVRSGMMLMGMKNDVICQAICVVVLIALVSGLLLR